jgi:HK97 gp10 family phage protein
MDKLTFQLEGFAEFEQQIMALGKGYRDDLVARQTLVKAAKKAMEVVLLEATARAPYDSDRPATDAGKPHLKMTTRLDARIPSAKDRMSSFVSDTDAAIAVVSVKKSAVSLSQEFGNVRTQAQPFLRIALERNTQKVLDELKSELSTIIPEYAKKLSRMRKK